MGEKLALTSKTTHYTPGYSVRDGGRGKLRKGEKHNKGS